MYDSRVQFAGYGTVFMVILLFGNAAGLASSLERNHIVETQTNVVAVTEESLKNFDKKLGAPAPTFKMVNDTGEFLTEEPVDKLQENKVTKEPSDSGENEEEDVNPTSEKIQPAEF